MKLPSNEVAGGFALLVAIAFVISVIYYSGSQITSGIDEGGCFPLQKSIGDNKEYEYTVLESETYTYMPVSNSKFSAVTNGSYVDFVLLDKKNLANYQTGLKYEPLFESKISLKTEFDIPEGEYYIVMKVSGLFASKVCYTFS